MEPQLSAQPQDSVTSNPASMADPSLSADGRAALARTEAANASVEQRRREQLAQAREQAKALFRQQAGVSTPPVPANAATAPSSAPQTPSQAAPPAAVPVQFDPSQILASLDSKVNAAAQAQAEAQAKAQAIMAEAERTLAAAKAEQNRMAALAQDPLKFLESQNINLDQWQARLLNGGAPTPEETLRNEVTAQVKAAEERAAKAEATVQSYIANQQRAQAVTNLGPMLQQEFPFVAAQLGAEGALDHVLNESRKAGKVVNPQELFSKLEAQFYNQAQQMLTNQHINTKYKLSVQSPQAEAVAQSPQTLTNRVTSTVAGRQSHVTGEADRIARGRAAIKQLLQQQAASRR